ncbi:MAG: Fe-S cluster assembly protein SufD, partial [Methylococcales bacterium]
MGGLQKYKADYQQLIAELPGQSLNWLQQLRADAYAAFSETGFPSLREEEWRYTNVSAIEKKLFSPLVSADNSTLDAAWLDTYALKDAIRIVIVNGRFCKEHSSLEGLPAAVTV